MTNRSTKQARFGSEIQLPAGIGLPELLSDGVSIKAEVTSDGVALKIEDL